MVLMYLPDDLREEIDQKHKELYENRPGEVPKYRVVEAGIRALDVDSGDSDSDSESKRG